MQPGQITIVQGLTISDPPLSRSVGVALASDHVHTYLERGTPLPAKRTFTHHTVASVAEGHSDNVLVIPVVQGELEQAHLCRLVGRIEIGGEALPHALPSGSAVEVTLERRVDFYLLLLAYHNLASSWLSSLWPGPDPTPPVI